MIVTNFTDLQTALTWIEQQEEIAYDLETAPSDLTKSEQALKPRKGQVIGIAVGGMSEGFYLVHKHLENGEFKTYLTKSQIDMVLRRLKAKKLITFNGSFDARFTRHYFGHDLAASIWSEGQLARHTADENLNPFVGLKDIAAELFGADAKAEQSETLESIIANGGSKGQVWLASLDLVGKYAIQDAILTAKVERHYRDSLISQGLEKFYFEEEVMELYRHVTIDLEDTGIKLDIPLMNETLAAITTDIQYLESQIHEKIIPYMAAFNRWYLSKTYTPKNSGEFAQAAVRYYGAILPRTANGAYSFANKAVMSLPDSALRRFIIDNELLPDNVVSEIQLQMQGNTNAFNLSSKHHLKRIFFDELKEKPLSYTEKTHEPQCDDDFLNSIKDKYDFVPLLLDFNKLNKIKSTYIERFLDKAEDGRFYPRFNQHTTISGRFSGDLQQLNRPIPKEDLDAGKVSLLVYKYNNIVRSFFIADDNSTFVDCDYNSLEPHVFSHVSGDDKLKSIFLDGLDFYSEIAIRTEKIQQVSARKSDSNFLGKVDPSRRQKAKAYSLGIPYGLGPYALSKHLNCSEAAARVLHKGYLDAFPQLKQWMDECKQDFVTLGVSKVESGRIRRFPKEHKIYKAYGEILLDPIKVWERWGDNPVKYKEMKWLAGQVRNAVNNSRNVRIQGLAASITNRASVAINKALKPKGGIVVAQIHDQLLVSVKQEHAEEAAKIVQDLMENTYKLSIPLKAPPTLAKNFKEGH